MTFDESRRCNQCGEDNGGPLHEIEDAWLCDACAAEALWPPDEDVRFDYKRQAWIVDGRYIACGHRRDDPCNCYGRTHVGEAAPPMTTDGRFGG